MDSRTRLDYALFQLTPTRTRCDLVVFAGKKNEKIASGLLEPFLSHLKSAKDQSCKGGYSIKLQLSSSDSSSWFTKATLERFVRFVSTPEIIERFVSIEKEIGQIEKSIESNEQVNGTVELQGADGHPKTPAAPSKSKVESNGSDDAEAEEKPKVRLHRVLESRKAILKKELAMAYARALAAGFEMEYLHDLVSFSDAFGAFRLREACINFMEICNSKNDDKIWMDEVAAVQASYIGVPGFMATGENNGLSPTNGLLQSSPSEGAGNASSIQQKTEGSQLPTWGKDLPPYGPYPIFPQYPGYMFPGFQVGPPQYPQNMQWPGSFHNPAAYHDRDVKKKDRNGNHSGDDDDDDSSDEHELETSLSNSEERSHKKKPSKRSSKKVVIRNINYIASSRNEEKGSDSESSSSEQDGYVDGDSIKQQVEAAVGSFKKHHKPKNRKEGHKSKDHLEVDNTEPPHSEEDKKDGNWDIFQNLLMKDSDTGSKTIRTRDVYSAEEAYGKKDISSSFDQKLRPKYASEDVFLTERSNGNGVNGSNVKFEGGEDVRGMVKRSIDEELLIPARNDGNYVMQNARLGTESSIVKPQTDEDWLIRRGSDISATPLGSVDRAVHHGDLALSVNQFQTGERKKDIGLDDSFMVQLRLSDGQEETQPKADIFMDSDIVGAITSRKSVVQEDLQGKVEASNFAEPEDLYMMIGRDSAVNQAVASWSPEMDYGNNVAKVVNVTTPVEASKEQPAKKLTGKEPKSKPPGGSLGRSKSAIPTRSNAIPTRSKTPALGSATIRNKFDKEEERRKKMEELLKHRQQRIAERSVAKGATPEKPNLQASSDESKLLHRPVMKSSTIDRLATARTTNQRSMTDSKVGLNKKPIPNGNTMKETPLLKRTKGALEQKDKIDPANMKPGKNDLKKTSSKAQVPDQTENGDEDFRAIKDLHTVTSVEKKEAKAKITSSDNCIPSDDILSVEMELQDNAHGNTGLPTPVTVNPTLENTLKPKIDEVKKTSFAPEISMLDISTPPLDNEATGDLAYSRKKWMDGESSPKAPKGFRKLMLFGRKS